MFLKNLLFQEDNKLLNRYLHVDYSKKPDIGAKKPDIGTKKPDIELAKIPLTNKTKENIIRLYQKIQQYIFGRKDIIDILGLSPSRSSELIKQMLEYNLISPVSGFGKGRYKFNS
jgi:DNA-binding MarR family transcriptional regulator